MQQMRGAMVRTQRVTTLGIDFQRHEIANFNLACANYDLMGMQTAQRLCRVSHFATHIAAGNDASVTHLAAALAIKWRLVGDDRDCVFWTRRLHFCAILHERDHLPLALIGGIASKLGAADTFGNVKPDVI